MFCEWYLTVLARTSCSAVTAADSSFGLVSGFWPLNTFFTRFHFDVIVERENTVSSFVLSRSPLFPVESQIEQHASRFFLQIVGDCGVSVFHRSLTVFRVEVEVEVHGAVVDVDRPDRLAALAQLPGTRPVEACAVDRAIASSVG